jgi:membrane fusion protein, multidrug efflux system
MKQLFLLLFSAAILAACNQNQNQSDKDITVPVSVMEVVPGSIAKYVSITGTVKPVKEVQLKSEITGNYRLLKNSVSGKAYGLNDHVNEGQELIWLEDAEYENNIKLTSLKLSLETSQQLFEKQKSLFEKGGVTQSDVKTAEVNFMNAKYAYDDALIRLQKMKVKAPFTGTIVDLPYYTPGGRVAASSLMVALMDYSKLYMDVNLAEKNIGLVKTGQPVLVTNYTLPDDTLKGMITQLSPAIDADTRSFKGTVEVSNADLKLRPGMYVKAEIVVASGDKTIVIPKNIVISKQRGNYVFVVEKGIALERELQFGLENTRDVQIVSGLKMGDRVVMTGFETLRDKSKVKVVK